MTKQNKIDYKSVLAQNLFLLSQNKKFQKDIDKLKTKHKKELLIIAKKRQASKLVSHEIGSNQLQKDIGKILNKIALFQRPEKDIVKAFVAFSLTNTNTELLLREVDKGKKINILVRPPWMQVDADEKGVAVLLSLSPYHTKTEVFNFIKSNWNKIEKATKRHKGVKKPQPFTNFAQDWKIYKDKGSHSYYEVVEKHNLTDISSASMIVTRINKRIKSLYSS